MEFPGQESRFKSGCISMRKANGLDAEVVARYRATGRGWQSRINADLKEVLHKGDQP